MVRSTETRLAVGFATAIDVGAVALLVAGSLTAVVCWLALALHVGATASLLLARGLPASRRALLLAFGFTIPIVGAAVAVLSRANSGRSELESGIAEDGSAESAEEEQGAPSPDARLIREVGEALALPEALLVADVDQRRAMLWGLGRRGDAEAIALLRWAVTATSTDLGLEAALALEDVATGFQKRLDAHRRVLDETPTCTTALGAVALITCGFETGVLDGASINAFAGEARRHCAVALELDRGAASEIALHRARLEIAVLRPDVAVKVLDHALSAATPALETALRRLRDEAALRANDLPWEGSSALLTYRRPLPPTATSSSSPSPSHRRRQAPYPVDTSYPVEARQVG